MSLSHFADSRCAWLAATSESYPALDSHDVGISVYRDRRLARYRTAVDDPGASFVGIGHESGMEVGG